MTVFAQWLDTYFAGFDRAILQFYHAMAELIGWLATPVLWLISFVGNEGIGLIILGVILLFFKKTRKSGWCVLFALLFGMLINNETIKPLVQRLRPYNSGIPEYIEWWKYVGAMEVSQFSFPSGHTTSAVASMLALGLTCKKKWVWWSGIAFVVLTGMSRNYFMVHYPTDIIGGAVSGTLGGILAVLFIGVIYKYIVPRFKKKN